MTLKHCNMRIYNIVIKRICEIVKSCEKPYKDKKKNICKTAQEMLWYYRARNRIWQTEAKAILGS